MKIKNGKIVEATESELFAYWLKSDWCELMSFTDYMDKMENCGVVIKERETK